MTRQFFISIALLVFFITTVAGQASNDEEYAVFLLVKDGDGVMLQKEVLEPNSTSVFTPEDVIAPILSFQPGSKSGDLIRADKPRPMFICRTMDGKVIVILQFPDGKQRQLPPIELSAAKQTITRVNVSGENGYAKAFEIVNYATIREATGPVVNMFGSQLALNAGDYALTIEVSEAMQEPTLAGELVVSEADSHFMVPGSIADGITGKFVIDTGAETSYISRAMLPEKAEISPLKMVEYSAEGKKTTDATTQGAGGTVDAIAGVYTSEAFKLDTLDAGAVEFTVMKEFPEALVKRGIDGVIGMDVIGRASSLAFTKNDKGEPVILLGKEMPIGKKADWVIPMHRVGNKFMLDGTFGEKPIQWILDSGAGDSILCDDFFKQNALTMPETAEKGKASGMDGVPVTIRKIKQPLPMSVGDARLDTFSLCISELDYLRSIGLEASAGLLGADFIMQFHTFRIDFQNDRIEIWK